MKVFLQDPYHCCGRKPGRTKILAGSSRSLQVVVCWLQGDQCHITTSNTRRTFRSLGKIPNWSRACETNHFNKEHNVLVAFRQFCRDTCAEDWQEAQAKGKPKKQQAPWLAVDDKMLQAMEVDMLLAWIFLCL